MLGPQSALGEAQRWLKQVKQDKSPVENEHWWRLGGSWCLKNRKKWTSQYFVNTFFEDGARSKGFYQHTTNE